MVYGHGKPEGLEVLVLDLFGKKYLVGKTISSSFVYFCSQLVKCLKNFKTFQMTPEDSLKDPGPYDNRKFFWCIL